MNRDASWILAVCAVLITSCGSPGQLPAVNSAVCGYVVGTEAPLPPAAALPLARASLQEGAYFLRDGAALVAVAHSDSAHCESDGIPTWVTNITHKTNRTPEVRIYSAPDVERLLEQAQITFAQTLGDQFGCVLVGRATGAALPSLDPRSALNRRFSDLRINRFPYLGGEISRAEVVSESVYIALPRQCSAFPGATDVLEDMFAPIETHWSVCESSRLSQCGYTHRTTIME